MRRKSDSCKQSFYIPNDLLDVVKEEARRQDRTLSWIMQQAFKIALTQLRKFPDAPRP